MDTQIIEVAKTGGGRQRIGMSLVLWELVCFALLLVTAAVAGRYFIVSISRALVEGLAAGIAP